MGARSPHATTPVEDLRRLHQAARMAHGYARDGSWSPADPPGVRVRPRDVLLFLVGMAVVVLFLVLFLATGSYPVPS